MQPCIMAPPLPERHANCFYLEFDKEEIENVSPYALLNIANNNGTIAPLYPAKDAAVKKCIIWLEVTDTFLNEYNRPQGSTLKEFTVVCSYTDAYLASLKKYREF